MPLKRSSLIVKVGYFFLTEAGVGWKLITDCRRMGGDQAVLYYSQARRTDQCQNLPRAAALS